MSHFLGGPPGWTDLDRLLALARKAHDADYCPSGAGPRHYRDECDEDSPTFTDPQPEPVESTCAWLVAVEEYQAEEEQVDPKHRERGRLVGWRDGSAVEDSDDALHQQDDPGDREDSGRGE